MEKKIFLPGDVVSTTTEGLMCGNGVYSRNGQIIASVRGRLSKISQLISIVPITSIYTPNNGDIVVGRITEIQKQRWKVQIGGSVLADLLLSAIYLPDGELRRRTTADERNMRQYFDVGDVICAEVQQARQDGSILLHTRQQHPKRLDNGLVIAVPSYLVKRVPNHLITLKFQDMNFQTIFGLNGSIWISPVEESGISLIPRIHNCFNLLATYEQQICPESICNAYQNTSSIPVNKIVSNETALQLKFISEPE